MHLPYSADIISLTPSNKLRSQPDVEKKHEPDPAAARCMHAKHISDRVNKPVQCVKTSSGRLQHLSPRMCAEPPPLTVLNGPPGWHYSLNTQFFSAVSISSGLNGPASGTGAVAFFIFDAHSSRQPCQISIRYDKPHFHYSLSHTVQVGRLLER